MNDVEFESEEKMEYSSESRGLCCGLHGPEDLSGVETLAVDLLNPSLEAEKSRHKLKRLVQSPNSYFMDVKCPGCFAITTVFSHAQTVVLCSSCSTVLCQPTGGKARLTEVEWSGSPTFEHFGPVSRSVLGFRLVLRPLVVDSYTTSSIFIPKKGPT
ncbi:16341_t:CDS:2, partial [Acaulospora colombiana]